MGKIIEKLNSSGALIVPDGVHIGGGIDLWTPEKLINKYGGIWLDPTFPGALTLNTQPNILDANMEDAGTASWPATGATVTKQPFAFKGSRCLRVSGLAAGQYASQNVGMISGNRYYCTSAVRGDGTAGGR